MFLNVISIVINLGYNINIIQYLSPALAILIFYSGVLIYKASRNWFIGIRTPWTLSSDFVWKKTHEIGSILFKISAVFCFFGMFFYEIAIWLILVPLFASVIFIYVYSYIIYIRYKNGRK